MLWWFERGGKHVQVEVLHLANGTYELHLLDEDGKEVTEHFTDAADLSNRQRMIQDALILRGWKRSGEWLL